MPVQTGTANTPLALYNALIGFLTNAAVMGSEVWTIAWQAQPTDPNPLDVVLAGPGLSNTETIYVGLRLTQDTVNNRFTVAIAGATGVIPSATTFDTHVNSTPDPKRFFLINQPMQYWFVANGRRFSTTVKVSNVYESAYAGFLLPYALPTNYSYPLFIGAMAGSSGNGAPLDWTDNSDGHRFYPFSGINTIFASGFNSSATFLDPQGQWLTATGARFFAEVTGQAGILPYEGFDGLGTNRNNTSLSTAINYPYQSCVQRIARNFENEYNLMQITLVQQSPSDQLYGVLDGVYYAPGNLQTAENIITISGVDHLVVPNAFRSGPMDFIAIRLS